MRIRSRTLAAASVLTLTLCGLLLACGADLMDAARDAEARLGGGSDQPLVCSFRARTGLRCVGCGGTRAFAAMARGDWRQALARNPLGAAAALGLWLLALAALLSLATGQAVWLAWSAAAVAGTGPLLLLGRTIYWMCTLPAGVLR